MEQTGILMDMQNIHSIVRVRGCIMVVSTTTCTKTSSIAYTCSPVSGNKMSDLSSISAYTYSFHIRSEIHRHNSIPLIDPGLSPVFVNSNHNSPEATLQPVGQGSKMDFSVP